jgi:streptogramin lyase
MRRSIATLIAVAVLVACDAHLRVNDAVWSSEQHRVVPSEAGLSTDLSTKNIMTFALPHEGRAPGPLAIALGSDGNMWFTEIDRGSVARITPTGTVTEFSDVPHGAGFAIVNGPSGDLWFTTRVQRVIGRIDTAGTITLFHLPEGDCAQYALVDGPDGNLWFTDTCTRSVGKMTPAGAVTEYPVAPCASSNALWGLSAARDGALWFTTTTTNLSLACYGKITTAGAVTLYTPSISADLRTIIRGPDGDLYAADVAGSHLVRITTAGVETLFATQLVSPYGLAVGPDRQIWMTGVHGQLEKFNPRTDTMSRVAIMPSVRGASPQGFNGIAQAPDGDMWFTSGIFGGAVTQYIGVYERP